MGQERYAQHYAPITPKAPPNTTASGRSNEAEALLRLRSLMTKGGGPMTDEDLLNQQSYPTEPIGKIKERLMGVPYAEPQDIDLPAEGVPSGPMGWLRALRNKIGI